MLTPHLPERSRCHNSEPPTQEDARRANRRPHAWALRRRLLFWALLVFAAAALLAGGAGVGGAGRGRAASNHTRAAIEVAHTPEASRAREADGDLFSWREPSPLAAIFTLNWSGTTTQGNAFSFQTDDARTSVSQIQFSANVGCGTVSTTLGGPYSVSGDSFTANGGGICPDIVVSGNFSSATAASGTIQLTYTPIPNVCPCSGSASVPWSASLPCGFSISPTSNSFGHTGGTGSISVTAAAGCAWTAVSNDSFITVTSGASGAGSGTVEYSVAANTGAARAGTITVAGQTFTVNQSAAPTPQTFVVTNTDDSGPGSLRQAITDANANPVPDTITFNIPGSLPHTISPTSALPTVTDPVVINGTTQPGFAGTPVVELNGAGAGAASSGLLITAGGSTVRGLVINGFGDGGIVLSGGGGNVVEGNFIGTNVAGTAALGNVPGMRITSANNTVGGTTTAARNLISGNYFRGVEISGGGATGNSVRGNFIGTDVTGTLALGNGVNWGGEGAVHIINGASNNTVGGTAAGAGNVISGNEGYGVFIGSGGVSGAAATGNVVQGNLIGTTSAGTAALANTRSGVGVFGVTGNTVGGSAAGARNVISGNAENGVVLDSPAPGNQVQGNYIGTDVSGTSAVGNLFSGVTLSGSGSTVGGAAAGAGNVISSNGANGAEAAGEGGHSILGNLIGTNAAGTSALGNIGNGVWVVSSNNAVGGTAAGARNVISGNQSAAILIQHGSANQIRGNYVGTNAAGTSALPNGGGVDIHSSNNTVGGTTAAARNVISGNSFTGVSINGATATGNVVQGNFIGTQADGASPLGNSFGGVVIQDAPNNTVGGTAAGAGNVIAFNNNGGGVAAAKFGGANAAGNVIRGNSIFSNAGLGIDLALGNSRGVTANDAGDADAGPNNFQNFPVLATVAGSGGTTNVQGTLNSAANTTYTLEFFASPCDPTGHGEGQTFLGAAQLVTDGGGNAGFNLNLAAALPAGRAVTATATDPSGNTSEFSQCRYQAGPDAGLTKSAPETINCGETLTYTLAVTNGGTAPAANVVITDSVAACLTDVSCSTTLGACTLDGHNATANVGTLAPGASATVTITGTANSACLPSVTNTASVASDGDVNSDNNASTVNTPVNCAPPFVVTNTNDSGPGSLRKALADADANVGVDTIVFNIPGPGPHVITLADAVGVAKPVRIDGTTQPGYADTPVVELNGQNIPVPSRSQMLALVGGNNTVRGLAFTRFGGSAALDLPVNGNNVVEGNYFGTNASGAALGNGGGVRAGSDNNRIGGTTPAARNVISGNGHGVRVEGASNVVQGNIISGNTTGVLITGGSGNAVLGNMIGTDASGTSAAGNGQGVNVASSNNTVGGTTPAARNIISGNSQTGVYLGGDGNLVQGNYIGTQADGAAALGNGWYGVQVFGSNNTVGGTGAGAGNVIAFNAFDGVQVFDGTGNSVLSNSIFDNGWWGINLGGDGVTPNDAGDADAGPPNNLQNFPALTSAISQGGTTTVQGTLDSAANTTFRLEFFLNAACNPAGAFQTGHGEGQTLLGSADVTTNAGGDAGFSVDFPAASAPTGHVITATATAPSGDTSEFSACAQVMPPPPSVSVGDVGQSEGNAGTTPFDFTVTLSAASTQTVTIGYATANDTAGTGDYASASGTLTFSPGETQKTVTVSVNGDTQNESDESFFVNLSAPTNAVLGDAQGLGTIVNDDTGPAVYVVANTADAGAGSLRQAILNSNANPAPDSIVFNIPTTDPNFAGGVFTIKPLSGLPDVTGGATTVDGATQTAFTGDTNPAGPEIVLDGGSTSCAPFTCNGLVLTSPNNTVSGIVVSNFSASGIVIFDSGGGATGNTVKGCYVGTNAAGTAAAGNGANGIASQGGNTIGGAAPGEGNVISGNGFATPTGFPGVGISSGDVVRGNRIGTNAAGTAAIPNKSYGLIGNTGGGTVVEGNLISGNAGGIFFAGSSAANNTVRGNKIGTDVTGTQPLGNGGHGVNIVAASGNTVGGIAAGQPNVIAFNAGDGVSVSSSGGTGVGNAILSNSIFGNSGLGIDLGDDGVTANDAGDGDSGANGLQNFPVLSTASTSGGETVIQGTLDAAASTAFDLQFFAGDACDASGNGEGQTLVGVAQVTTDASGAAAFALAFAGAATTGQFVTANATGPGGDTSEFSQCVQVTAGPPPPSVSVGDVGQSEGNAGTTPFDFTVSLSAASSLTVTVNYATADGTATAGNDYASASGTLTFSPGETQKTVTVSVNGDAAVEPGETFFVNLSSPTHATLADAQGQGTITNDDQASPAPGVWTQQTSGTSNTLFSVHFPAPGVGWAVGLNSTILHTSNGGATWSQQSPPGNVPNSSYLGVRFLDANVGWAGGGQVVLRTADGGATWTSAGADPVLKFRNSLFAVSPLVAWAPANSTGGPSPTRWFSRYTAGAGGGFTEEDFGVIATGAQHLDLYFVDADNGWSVGTNGQIIRITNASGGSPSFSFQTSGTTARLNGVHMLDLNRGWVVGDNGTILKTENGGATWAPQTSGTNAALRDVHFTDQNRGWAVGAGGLILATADGGATWGQEASGTTNELRGIFFAEAGYAVGAGGTILKRACTYSISPASESFAPAGGAGQISVTTQAGCPWTAVSNDSFITITSGASGGGNGAAGYSVAANTGAARSGTITVAGQTFTVNQSAGQQPLRIDSVTPAAGRAAGGQSVRLSGEFAGLSSVTVGGSNAAWFYTNGGGDTTQITLTTPSHAPGAVAIDLVPTAGSPVTKPKAFAYLQTVFTDDELAAGVTVVKAQHLLELRQAADALRDLAGLAPAQWSQITQTPGETVITAAQIVELRTNLEEAAGALGYGQAVYTDPVLGAGSVVKRVHIEELRQRIRNIAG